MKYDFIVIGGGIAGIAISELLQRSGCDVLLIEKNQHLCAESSASQQGWFHSGALYAALPNKKHLQAAIDNRTILNKHYASFPGMNLLTTGDIDPNRETPSWFENNNFIYFYVNNNDSHLSWLQKFYWQAATKGAQRSLRRHFGLSKKLDDPYLLALGRVLNAKQAFSSQDRTMNTHTIAHDLTQSFISSGGCIRLNTEIISIKRNLVSHIHGIEEAREIIVSSGSSIPSLTKTNVSIIQSPLLVVNQALANTNFVKMHPNIAHSFNHVLHKMDGRPYSVIGNALFFNTPPDLNNLHRNILSSVNKAFKTNISMQNSSIFLGKKIETPSTWLFSRNYRPMIATSNHSIIALPGKFSFCFSLAIDICNRFAIRPSIKPPITDRSIAPPPILMPQHSLHIQKLRSNH